MTDILRFRKFPVYRLAREFRRDLKRLSRSKFPVEEQFCLTQQLWRSLDSILLNIAEGSDKYSDIDFRRYLNIALGSVNEAVSCLDAALDDAYVLKSEHEGFLGRAEELVRQLKAFSGKLGNK
jgi:four helix bundle protein